MPVRWSIPWAAVAVGLVAAGCTGGQPATDEVAADVTVEAEQAGCDVALVPVEGDPVHLDPEGSPPPEDLYPQRPPTAGPHLASWLPPGVHERPVDERAAVHNLEHGAVVVWYQPTLPEDQLEALTAWAEQRNADGLADERTGAGVLVAPFEDEAMLAPVTMRAWEVAADCAAFDATFADGFVRSHFGPAGRAPERTLAPDPAPVLERAAGSS